MALVSRSNLDYVQSENKQDGKRTMKANLLVLLLFIYNLFARLVNEDSKENEKNNVN